MTTAQLIESRSGTTDLLDNLRAIVGSEGVRTDLAERVFHSTDIFVQGPTAEAVVRPTTAAQVSAAVARCAAAGRAVIPQGGGFSYTQGYVPPSEASVIFDLRGLNRIVEINGADLWVKVEVGVTWAALHDALKPLGYRTPFFGPLSGFRSTIGGALSQGAFFLGSSQYGTGADSTLGLDIVLADGTAVTTGSAGSTHTNSPFLRNYGPDLTGLFLHDSGALALKTAAYLRLIPWPTHQRVASFAFEGKAAGTAAISAIARAGLAAECYLWDPTFVHRMRARNSVVDDLRYMKGVVASGASLWSGLRNAAKLATEGNRVLDSGVHLLHVVTEDALEGVADARLAAIRTLAADNGGGEVSEAIGRAMRANPFIDIAATGRNAPDQRNLPVHGLFPHSAMPAVCAAVDAYFADQAGPMAAHGISQGTICCAVGSTAVCIEPLLFWTDPQLAAHDRFAGVSDLATLARFPKRTPAAEAVARLRDGLVAILTAHGAAHAQIGRAYPYRETRALPTWDVLQRIKAVLDPAGAINPGALGLTDSPSSSA